MLDKGDAATAMWYEAGTLKPGNVLFRLGARLRSRSAEEVERAFTQAILDSTPAGIEAISTVFSFKLGDIGLGKALRVLRGYDGPVCTAHEGSGTPEYMALEVLDMPEEELTEGQAAQHVADSAGSALDVYALGVTALHFIAAPAGGNPLVAHVQKLLGAAWARELAQATSFAFKKGIMRNLMLARLEMDGQGQTGSASLWQLPAGLDQQLAALLTSCLAIKAQFRPGTVALHQALVGMMAHLKEAAINELSA